MKKTRPLKAGDPRTVEQTYHVAVDEAQDLFRPKAVPVQLGLDDVPGALSPVVAAFQAVGPERILVEDVHDFDFEVTAGVLDDEARMLFTSGHCHSLALAVHERTGFPIVGFREIARSRIGWDGTLAPNDDDEWEPLVHFAVLAGPNTMLDVNGAYPLDVYTAQNLCEALIVETPVGMDAAIWADDPEGWLTPDPELGDKFVDAVLELLEA